MLKPFLELGRIVGTHGVRGELRVQPWCDTPSFLCKFSTVYLGNEKKAFHVLSEMCIRDRNKKEEHRLLWRKQYRL